MELQANSLAILRTEGQDTQRAFAGARWDRRSLTRWGQELLLTAYARGDVYHSSDNLLTSTVIYRGQEGWQARAIGALAAEARWPLVGPFMGGTQRLTPRLQLIASGATDNLEIPNEDARAVDLEDSNLFALNRFPGYDRWENGPRVTYGVDWGLDLPGIAVRTTIGQSYRLDDQPSILPPGTGLSDRFSDFVGRTNVKFGRKLNLVHRFRIDKESLALRRNEVDAVVGGRQTYATIGYLRLDREYRPGDRGSARPRGDPARRPGPLRPLLVGLRLDRHRPHRRQGKPALVGGRLRAGPPPHRNQLRRRLPRDRGDLAARLRTDRRHRPGQHLPVPGGAEESRALKDSPEAP